MFIGYLIYLKRDEKSISRCACSVDRQSPIKIPSNIFEVEWVSSVRALAALAAAAPPPRRPRAAPAGHIHSHSHVLFMARLKINL